MNQTALDRTFYVILCKAREGSLYAAERDGFDLTSRDHVVHDIVTDQVSNVQRVLAFNPVEGWSRDDSEDIARECARLVTDNGVTSIIRRDLRDFIDTHASDSLPVHKFEPAVCA